MIMMSDLRAKGIQCDKVHDVQSRLSESVSSWYGHSSGALKYIVQFCFVDILLILSKKAILEQIMMLLNCLQ